METLQRTANRGSVSTGYDIDNSCVFEDANSEAMKKSLSGQSRDCFTISFWHKRSSLGASRLCGAGPDGNNEVIIHFTSSNELEIYSWEGAYAMRYKTNRVFRDTSAFYHFAFLIDTRLSTASERTQIYVNGVLETSFSVSVVPGQNALFDWTTNIQVGRGGPSADADMSGYLAEFVYLDDTKAAHTDLGEFDSDTGIWIPKDVSGLTFGTNGAYLDFKDSSNMGNDANGGTDFTLINITAADQATDTPTNNFATLNPLHYTTKYTITEGATNQVSSADGWGASVGSVGVTSGKWYFEVQSADTNGYTLLGVIDQDSVIGTYVNADAHAGDAPYGIAYYGGNGSIITNGSALSGVSFPSWTTETMGCALDLDNNKIYFSKSGTYGNSGDPASGSNGVSLPTGGSGTWFISTSTYYAANPAKTNQGGYTTNTPSSAASDANGYGTFEYAPPSGYYAICTKNLAEFG